MVDSTVGLDGETTTQQRSILEIIGNSVDQFARKAESWIDALVESLKSPSARREDEIRKKIESGHRFHSFADEKHGCFVKWHISGHDYFWAVSEMIDSAQDSIFIMDWWLSPELYLRRPPASYPQWRLDRLLKRKAEQGVKIFVIVYKEVVLTMPLDSAHTQEALEALHPNIACMRHPDHLLGKHITEIWSHHEKVLVVDGSVAAIGGFDLCFGRWDTRTHPLTDAHPTDLEQTLFPGQDYNNARFMDFKSVEKFNNYEVSTLEIPRMPWHDIHMTLVGPVVDDIVRHFVERWNFVKNEKNKHNAHYQWLKFSNDRSKLGDKDHIHHVLKKPRFSVRRRPNDDVRKPKQEDTPNRYGNCNVQVIRSVSEWSHGVQTETSIQNAYIDLINQAEHFIYIENQYFISNTEEFGSVRNLIAQALLNKIIQKATGRKRFMVFVVIPEMPGFAGDLRDLTAPTIAVILEAQWRTMNRGGHSLYEGIRAAGFEPRDYIRFYHLRTYDRINGPLSLIQKMESKSGIPYHQAQVALSRQWLGRTIPKDEGVQIRVAIPHANTRDIRSMGAIEEKHSVTIEAYRLPKTEAEAKQIITQFEAGAPRSDKDVSDTIGQHAQLDATSLKSEKWLGTEQEEKDALVSELVYIHTKLMIVDDRRVILGSANLNDRSMRGDGDSEIALVVEDQDTIASTMDGRPYMAAQFATTLRRQLFRIHLGLVEPEIISSAESPVTSFMRPAPIPNDATDVYDRGQNRQMDPAVIFDPLSNKFQKLWDDVAKKNRSVYTEVFRSIPNDAVKSWADYKTWGPKVKTGHVADSNMPLSKIKAKLSEVRGHLVEAPLDFLIKEKGLVNNLNWDGLDPALAIWL